MRGPRERGFESGIGRRQPQVIRARKPAFDAGDLLGNERRGAVFQVRPLGIDFLAEFLGPAFLHQDLDARLVDVVAPSVTVMTRRMASIYVRRCRNIHKARIKILVKERGPEKFREESRCEWRT